MSIHDAHIKNIDLLSALKPEQIKRIAQGIYPIHLEEKEILFQFSEPAERFFYVQSGMIKLFRMSPDGTEKVIDIVLPMQTFAIAVVFLEKSTYPVSSQALTKTTLYAVNKTIFLEVIRESMDTCMRIMAHLSQRVHHCISEINNISLHNAIHRLAAYLSEEIPENTTGNASVVLSMPKNIIASRLSIKAETFSRLLHTLTKEEIIQVEGKIIHILDVKRLRQWTGENA